MAIRSFFSLRIALVIALLGAGGLLAYAISQEEPRGSLQGKTVMQENSKPIPVNIVLRQKGNDSVFKEGQSGEDGQYSFMQLPTGKYEVEAWSGAHQLRPTELTVEEGKTRNVDLELKPGPPQLDLDVHQHMFTPDERARITCRGFLDARSVDFAIYKVDIDTFVGQSAGSLQNLLGMKSYYEGQSQPSVPLDKNPALSPVDSFVMDINKKDAEGTFTQRLDLPQLGSGIYVISAKSKGLQRLGWMMVTSLGLVAKTAASEVLTFATDLKTGAPAPGVDISCYQGNRRIASGVADSTGLTRLALQTKPGDGEQRTIIARSGENVAFVDTWYWNDNPSADIAYAYTDRPVYRPGQEVFFKGIVRRSTDGSYSTPKNAPVTVEVRDTRDTLVYKQDLTTDQFGSYNGTIKLNDEAPTGYYSIISTVNGKQPEQSAGFAVAAYRKPEYTVSVKFDKKRYVRGERVKATISANFFFGSPVTNAKVSYEVLRSPYWLFDYGDEYGGDGDYQYEEGGYGGYGESVLSGDVRTDGNGEAVIEFPAKWDTSKDEQGTDQEYTVQANAVDTSGREVSGEGSVVATMGEFSVEVTPDVYVSSPEGKVDVEVRAMDYDKHPVVNKDIELKVGRSIWNKTKSRFEKTMERRVRTDNNGRAHIEFSPGKEGEYEVIAATTDSRRNTITSNAYVWSYGEAEGYGWGERRSNLKIVTDKKIYNPGDKAKVLITVDKPGITALVTVEGERVYDQYVVPVKGNMAMVEVPVKSNYKPNFYIGVCYVRSKDFTTQQARAKVSIADQTLNVKIEPNKTKYEPGDTVTYHIKTTDSKGRPTPAQLSMGVVDESIYSIRKDDTEPINDFFYAQRPNQVSTEFSFPRIYLSDAAKEGEPSAVDVRRKFKDTAYWNPTLVTGANGEGQVSFQLPDNITTWRATVRGITSETVCGQATNKVICRKPLMVRLETPRFMVQSDRATVSAVVHNYTGKAQKVRVDLSLSGAKLRGRSFENLTIKNNGSARVDWQVDVPGLGQCKLTAQAVCTDANDAVETTLPILPHGVRRESLRAGDMSGDGVREVSISTYKAFIPQASDLTIRLSPSIASSLLGSLEYLAQYPYGCVEQTTSSFLPDVIVWQTMKTLGHRDPKLEAQLPPMVESGLAKLYNFQNGEGGWGWCEYSQSDPWMTAYVCYALIRAKQAGFAVNEQVLSSGLETLGTLAKDNKVHLRDRIFGFYVLALSGQNVNDSLISILQRKKLDSRTLATLSLSFSELGNKAGAEQALNRLYAKAIVEPDTIHWSDQNQYDWYYYGSDIETTALALEATTRVDPTDPRLTSIVRWLMARRQGGRWISTRDSAMALYAVSDYVKRSGAGQVNYDAVVLVNGKQVDKLHFDQESLFQAERVIVVSGTELSPGKNVIEIRKTGTGNLSYSATLDQYVAMNKILAVGTRRLSIVRHYYKPSPRYYQEYKSGYLGQEISQCAMNDVVLVRLAVTTDKPLDYMLLEDYIPAGFEVVDQGGIDYWDWDYWWVDRDVRDDKVSFYLESLSKGKHSVEYQMRAISPGSYHALPAVVWAMYQPSLRSATAERGFEVK